MASTKLELGLLWSNSEQMNISRSVLVKGHRFQKDVIILSLRCYFIYQVDNLIDSSSNFKSVWVHLFADFTLESLPVE